MDPKKLGLAELRELARKHLKKGYSTLSRTELLAALKDALTASAAPRGARDSKPAQLAAKAKAAATRVKEAAKAKVGAVKKSRAADPPAAPARKRPGAKAAPAPEPVTPAKPAAAATRAAARIAAAARTAATSATRSLATKGRSRSPTKTASRAGESAQKSTERTAPAPVKGAAVAPVAEPVATVTSISERRAAQGLAREEKDAPIALPSPSTAAKVVKRVESADGVRSHRAASAGPSNPAELPLEPRPPKGAPRDPAASVPPAPPKRSSGESTGAGGRPVGGSTHAKAFPPEGAPASPPGPLVPPAAASALPEETPASAIESSYEAFRAPDEIHFAEPLIEGFFVARIWGEGEARRHHLLEALSFDHPPLPPDREGLGDLPVEPTHDVVVALPRDPGTLAVIWALTGETIARSLEGVEEPRAVLRLFEDAGRPREYDVMLEMRGYYVHGLIPGESYRAELLIYDRVGRSRRVGPSSNRVQLPRFGPSISTEVRFMRVAPGASTEEELRAARGHVQRMDVAHFPWGRFDLPHSATYPASAQPGPSDVALDRGPGHWTPPRSGSGRGDIR